MSSAIGGNQQDFIRRHNGSANIAGSPFGPISDRDDFDASFVNPQLLARIDQVRVADIRIVGPEVRPVMRVLDETLGNLPQGVSLLDRVDDRFFLAKGYPRQDHEQ